MKKLLTHMNERLQHVCSVMHFAGAWRHWPRVAVMPVHVTHSLYTGFKAIR